MSLRKRVLFISGVLLALVLVVWVAAPDFSGSMLKKISGFASRQLERLAPQVQSSAALKRPHDLTNSTVSFAVIGDYGLAGQGEADVAKLVRSWNPDFVISAGDNNYDNGAAVTIDQNVGQYFHDYIYPYKGGYGPGAKENKFFPVLGNHDWITSDANPYENYFQIPGNKRYYDFIKGPVHFYMLDSDPNEPDGTSDTSVQAMWLKDTMGKSTSPWDVVVLHHAPFSSGTHGPTVRMQWPFKAWGANAVLSGHDHIYERLLEDNFPYFVNGLGGATIYEFGLPVAGSQARYNGDYGAMRVTASDTLIKFEFFNRSGDLIDSFTLGG
jgi:hypothetical protein